MKFALFTAALQVVELGENEGESSTLKCCFHRFWQTKEIFGD